MIMVQAKRIANNSRGHLHMMKITSFLCLLVIAFPSSSQPMSARSILEEAAEAMGGLNRILNTDSLVISGFSLTQGGGQNASPHPKAPPKWAAQNGIVRTINLNT